MTNKISYKGHFLLFKSLDINIKLILMIVTMCSLNLHSSYAQPTDSELDLKLEYNESAQEYEVYQRIDTDYDPGIMFASQATLVFPGDFNPADFSIVQSFLPTGSWVVASSVIKPLADSNHVFIRVRSPGGNIDFIPGAWQKLFSFSTNVGCIPHIRLFENSSDPGPSAPGMGGVNYLNVISVIVNGLFYDVYRSNKTGDSQKVYVDVAALGNNSGTSWADAYTTIGDALANLDCWQNEVWVAEGIYRPSSSGNRNSSFRIRAGIEIYGGFIGVETDRDLRLGAFDQTVLSGDIGTLDDMSDNSYNVVDVRNNGVEPCTIDGFLISNGNANHPSTSRRQRGGGISVRNSNASIQNCSVSNNAALDNGAGIYVFKSDASIENVAIANNAADQHGGGLFVNRSEVNVGYTSFNDNFALSNGGGMYVNRSTILMNGITCKNNDGVNGGGIYLRRSEGDLAQVLVVSNASTSSGSALYINRCTEINIYNSTCASNSPPATNAAVDIYHPSTVVNIFNSIFWNDEATEIIVHDGSASASFCNIRNGFPGTSISDLDPEFESFDDYHLSNTSPLLDLGLSFFIPNYVMSDLDGNARIVGLDVDLGVYENPNGSTPLRKSDETIEVQIALYPNPTIDFLNIKQSSSIAEGEFVIVDAMGKLIRSGTLTQKTTEISVQDLLAGQYHVITVDGNHRSHATFIKL